MRRAAFVVGVGVVAFFCFPFLLRLREITGGDVLVTLLALVGAAGFGSTWVGHTEQSKRLAEHVRRAMRMTFSSDKEAAIEAGMSQPHLSMCLAGAVQGPMWKWAAWGRTFWVNFCKSYLESDGEYLVITRADFREVRMVVNREQSEVA